MVKFCQKIVDAPWFTRLILTVIILAGILVGLETDAAFRERWAGPLAWANFLILVIFVLEIGLKLLARSPRFWTFFQDPWNVFDFLIVAVCVLPLDSDYITVLRLLRLLRVLRLIRAVPRLQVIVGALLKSIPSMFYVSSLLLLFFYVYAVAATFLFGANDPVHFRTLTMSLLTLFRVVTLEDWTDVMYINMYGCDAYGYEGAREMCTAPEAAPLLASLFFVSFVLLGTMVILNLFIGVIMTGMEEASREAGLQQDLASRSRDLILHQEVHEIHRQLDGLMEKVSSLKLLTEKPPESNP